MVKNGINLDILLLNYLAKIDRQLFLIKEELKSRKFFKGLQSAGIDDVYSQPHLDQLILASFGLDDSDETYMFYFEIMDRRSKKIVDENDSIVTQAIKVYIELVAERKRRKQVAQESR